MYLFYFQTAPGQAPQSGSAGHGGLLSAGRAGALQQLQQQQQSMPKSAVAQPESALQQPPAQPALPTESGTVVIILSMPLLEDKGKWGKRWYQNRQNKTHPSWMVCYNYALEFDVNLMVKSPCHLYNMPSFHLWITNIQTNKAVLEYSCILVKWILWIYKMLYSVTWIWCNLWTRSYCHFLELLIVLIVSNEV